MAFDDIDPPAPSLQQQQIVSDKIKKLIEEYEEPDLAFVISNTETKTLEIPFEKKNETDLPKKKRTYFDFETKSNKDFYVYDYVGDFKKFGFLWKDTRIGLVYEIDVIGNKLRKILTMSRNERKKLAIDETRVWNIKMTRKKNNTSTDRSRISFSEGCLYNESDIKTAFGINDNSFDFTALSAAQKSTNLLKILKTNHSQQINTKNMPYFFSYYPFTFASIIHVRRNIWIFYADRTVRLFVPKFYHEKRNTSFLRKLTYIGGKKDINENGFCENKILGRKLYEYCTGNDHKNFKLQPLK